MTEIQIVDLREIFLSNSSFGPREIEEINHEISNNYAQFAVMKDVIAEMAGHRSIQTTQRYIDVNDDMMRNAAELI